MIHVCKCKEHHHPHPTPQPHPKPNPSVTWHQVHEASASERQHPTPPRPNPEKRALDEKKEENTQIPMVGGHTRTRAERHPEGTTRGPFFIAQFLSSTSSYHKSLGFLGAKMTPPPLLEVTCPFGYFGSKLTVKNYKTP